MQMRKTIIIAVFAVVAVALLTATALAYYPGGQGNNTPYGGNGAAQAPRGGGMMHGQLGQGYGPYGNSTSPNSYSQQNPSQQQYEPWADDYDGCPMMYGWGQP